MKCFSLGGMRAFLLTAVMSVGVIFAALLFAASVSVIGFKILAAVSYGAAVFLLWIVFDALGRFCGERFAKHEPWIVMAVFFVMYLALLQIVPELGQIKMPYDSMRAQNSLEAGHFAFFRPWKFYHWINYDFLLSALGIIFSPKLIVGQTLNAVCRALALYPIFRLCERITGRGMARFVTIMVGISPTLTIYATTLVGDYISALFYLYAVYLFLSVSDWGRLSTKNIYLWIFVGLLAGIGFLFKSLSIFYFAAFVIWMAVKVLESRGLKVVLVSCVALLSIALSHGMVKSTRSTIFHTLLSDPKEQISEGESFVSAILYEMYIGMYIPTKGGYLPARDRAIRSVPEARKMKMVKNMLVRSAGKYPKFLVDKFRMLWGANDDSTGSILFWFRMSCQNDCYNLRDKNHCVPWLAPLLRSEHLFFAIAFLLGAVGLFLSRGKSLDFTGPGIVSLVIVLLFAAMSVLIESQGRYRTAIYPFFFLVMPYAHVWLRRLNPFYVRIAECVERKLDALGGGQSTVSDGQNLALRETDEDEMPRGESAQVKSSGGLFGFIAANKGRICPALVWTAIGVLLFLVVVVAVVTVIDLKQDYPTHIRTACAITWRKLFHPIMFFKRNCYPVWHILTWWTMRVFDCGGRPAAAVVTAASVVGTWFYAAVYFSKRCRHEGVDVARAASVYLMLAMPIWLPFFNPNLVLGQGGPNILHNPTNLMVRLLALPCFVWYVAIMDGIGRRPVSGLSIRRLVFLSLLVFLATLSKPSFVQMFVPAIFLLAVFKVIKYGKRAIWPVLAVMAFLVPTLLLVALQTWVSFLSPQSGDSGIGIAFLKFSSHFSPNVFVSTLLGIAFPLIILLWSIRTRKISTADVLAWLMYGIAWMEGALLIEKGRRMWHGNFTWGINLAMFLLWFTSIDRFLSLTREYIKSPADSRQKWWFRISVVLLSLHIVSGVCYIYRVTVLHNWM